MSAEQGGPGAPQVTDLGPTTSPGGPRAVLRGVWRDRNGRIGVVVTGLLLLLAAVAALGLTADPLAQDPEAQLQGPSAAHWFGTALFGRDVAARTFAGIAASLRVAVLAVLVASVVGSIAGVVAGYVGGAWDQVIGRVTDVLFAFPAVLLALAIIAGFGRGWVNTVIAIAVVYVPIFVRVARGPTLSVRSLDHVAACRVLGFPGRRTVLRHVLPNVSGPIVVQVALALSWAILTEAGLSFLGLGTQPPDPSLGLMVSESRTLVSTAWWAMTFPALAVVVAVIALNLLGDGLSSALDPKGEGRR